jgi:hypothetical protein
MWESKIDNFDISRRRGCSDRVGVGPRSVGKMTSIYCDTVLAS